MLDNESSYYAEISILVDGWPWNLSEFDFRRWFAPGVMPSLLDSAETMSETPALEHVAAVSENRRMAQPSTSRRSKRGNKRGKRANKYGKAA